MKFYNAILLLAIGKEVADARKQPSGKEIEAIKARIEDFGTHLDKNALPPMSAASKHEVYLQVIDAEPVDTHSSAEVEVDGDDEVYRPVRLSLIVEDKKGQLNSLKNQTRYLIEGHFAGFPRGQDAVIVPETAVIKDLGKGLKKINTEVYAHATMNANDYDVWRALRIGGYIFCEGTDSHTDEDERCSLVQGQGIWDWPGFAHIYAKNVDSWTCNHWRYFFECDLSESRLRCEPIGSDDDNQGRSTLCRLEACLSAKPERNFNPPTPYPFSPTNTKAIVASDTVWDIRDRVYQSQPTTGKFPPLNADACPGFQDTDDLDVNRKHD